MFGLTERVAADLARTQHGLLTRRDLRAAGVTAAQIRRRLDAGAWLAMSHQVFRLASAPATWNQRVLAAVLHHPLALASGRTAATLHRLDGAVEGAVEVTVPVTGSARSSLSRVRRSRYFDQLGRTSIDGVPTVSVAEAVFQLASGCSDPDLERIVDTAIATKKMTLAAFADVHARHAGDHLPKVAFMRALIDSRLPHAPTPLVTALEARLDRLLDQPDLPEVRSQLRAAFSPDRPLIVDRYISDWQLVIEADGRTWHTRVADFERDRWRDNLCTAQGLHILRFTWSMLTEDTDGCLHLIRAVGRRQMARSA